MRRASIVIISAGIAVAGCNPQEGKQQLPVGANGSANVLKPPHDPFGWPILDRNGKQIGTVATRLDQQGVSITLNSVGLPPGMHGVHIHQIAKCTAPAFESAGGHLNWANKKHGHNNPEGYHSGDLGNLSVGPDGRAQATFVVAAKDWDPKAVGGWPIVIHAAADDERTDPSGNSGERIACGVFFVRRD